MRSDVNSAIKPSLCNTNTFKGLILEKNIHRFSKQEVVIRKDIVLGQGMFGKCFYGSFGPVEACIKVLRPCHDNEIFIHEANMMSSLCHSNVTYLHGVCLDGKYNILLLSYHGIKFESHTLHSALFSEKSTGLTRTQCNWKSILIGVISGLKYIHEKNILHNDIKEDNVVISESTAVIIDFGKACFKKDGRTYKLSQLQRQQYKAKHPHICPALRDGNCMQNISTDVYSFGRILSHMADKVLPFPSLIKLANECMGYDHLIRPKTDQLFTFIFNLCE